MEQNSAKQSDFNSINFVLFLWKRRKILAIVTVIAIAASVVFSMPFFITPKYKSTVVMFPTSTNSISKALLAQNQGAKQDILQFGEEEQSEQLLQMLNSSKIRNRIIEKYDLMKHYEIDSTSPYKNTLLAKEFESNITFRRTENMAVEIAVMDKSPEMAANIANDIADLLDSTKIKMQRERAINGFLIVEKAYNEMRNQIQIMEDSLTKLRELGVHDYETQAEMINQQLAIELARNPNSNAVKALDAKLAMLAKYAGPYVSIRDQLEYEKRQLTEIKAKYEEAKVDAEEELPQTFRVDNAFKAEKKSYPVRWLIVLITTVSALLLTVFVLIIVDTLSQLDFKKS